MNRQIDLKDTDIDLNREEPFTLVVKGRDFLFVEKAWKEHANVPFRKDGRVRQATVQRVDVGKFPGAIATFQFVGPLQSAA